METKKTKIIGIVSLVAIALTVITATYAFFQAQVGDPAAVDISINANTVDTFTFSVGDPISINLNQENFATGTGNQTSTTTASAMLTANNKTNSATEAYYMYLKITDNTYTYSIGEDTPEIILTVTDASGSAVEISDLTPVTATGANGTSVTGYDITNKSGLITILNNREITTTSSKEEKWNITITFINYDKDQSANAGKSMSAKVMIQKDEIVRTVDGTCKSGQTLSSCIVAMNGIDETLYHHDGTLENGINDGSYRYAGGNYQLTNKATSEGYTTVVSESGGGVIQVRGSFYLSYDSTNTEYSRKDAINKAVSDGYLAENVKNYVCFGSDAETCPTNNLYRIIGVFGDKVKLIKADFASSTELGGSGVGAYAFSGSVSEFVAYDYSGNLSTVDTYYWNNSTNTNLWSESNLNTINLNTNFITYLNNINTKWANMIATTTWKVGGNTYSNIRYVVLATAYTNEITNPVTTNTTDSATEYSAKIGLMYVSDYGFAASPSAWSTTLSYYSDSSVTAVNWMYLGMYEWTISRTSDGSSSAFLVYSGGGLGSNTVGRHDGGVRPVFYLESTATYSVGDGSLQSPIRLG